MDAAAHHSHSFCAAYTCSYSGAAKVFTPAHLGRFAHRMLAPVENQEPEIASFLASLEQVQSIDRALRTLDCSFGLEECLHGHQKSLKRRTAGEVDKFFWKIAVSR
jgi:hypothetical protein